MFAETKIPALPDYVLDAIPGAREAAEKHAALEAEMRGLRTAVRAATQAAAEVIYLSSGQPRPGHTTAEHEQLRDIVRQREDAVRAQESKLKASMKAFAALTSPSNRPEGVERAAAAFALGRQAAAVEAWDTLAAALKERDQAYDHAGRPGIAWNFGDIQAGSRQTLAAQAISARLKGFSVSELEAVAAGDYTALDPDLRRALLEQASGAVALGSRVA